MSANEGRTAITPVAGSTDLMLMQFAIPELASAVRLRRGRAERARISRGQTSRLRLNEMYRYREETPGTDVTCIPASTSPDPRERVPGIVQRGNLTNMVPWAVSAN